MRGHVSSYQTKTQGRRWRIVFDAPPGPDGERRRTTRRGFRTKEDAERALREAIGAVETGAHVDPSTVTVGTYLRTWLEGCRVRVTTRARYRQSIEHHLIPQVGGIRLQQLTAQDLDRCYRTLEVEGGRRGQGLSAKTVLNAHGTLHRALEDAVERGYVVRNVASYANPPKVERQEMRVWSSEQLRRFLDHVADDRLFALWVTYATTGLRRGELLGARWDALDLDARRLIVDRNLTVVDGRPIISRPKTSAGRRMIALDGYTVTVLTDHRRRQREERIAAGPAWQDHDLVFCWEDGSPIHPHNPSRWFRELTEELGLPHIKLHGLRHTYATVALKAGVDIKVLSSRLGHASTTITRELYQHVTPEMDDDAAAAIAEAIFGR